MTSNRRMEFFIGMMVIGIIAGVFVMTILFGSEKSPFIGSSGGKSFAINFKKGNGISTNSLVMKNGIKIGRVSEVKLEDDPEQDGSFVRVTVALDPGAKIYSNEQARINRTLLGDASIEIEDAPDKFGEVYEIDYENSLVTGVNSGDLMGTVSSIEGDLAQALQNINKASEGVTVFMENINTILGDESELQLKKERLASVFTELEGALSSIRSLASNMDAVVSDPEIIENIRTSTNQIPKLLEKMDDLSNGAKQFITDANSMGADVRNTLKRAETTFDLVDKNLDNIDVFTTSLAENAPQMMTALNESSVEIKGTISNIRTAVDNISSLAANLNEKLDDPNSAIGLLGDAETAKSLRHIVRNAEEITQKLYPILDDARVFSNKVAHKPSSLIWDKTTYKGSNSDSKYGFQSLSPSGGVSSPLYRQTPNGARIRERSYYNPAADEDYMDPETRAVYRDALAQREYSKTLPTTNPRGEDEECGFGLFKFGRNSNSTSARAQRAKWSLASFWENLGFGKNKKARDAAVYDGYDAEYYQDGYEVGPVFAGYEGDVDDYSALAQPTYDYGGYQIEEGYGDGSYGNYGNNGSYGAAGNDEPTYARGSDAPRPVGPYQSGDETAPSTFSDDNLEIGEIEELPPSINRPGGAAANSFEDDGLPLEFAPPTR